MQLFLAFSLSTRLKCNSDVNADSLSIIQYALSRSISLSSHCSFCSLCCCFIEEDVARGEEKMTHVHSRSPCSLWSACHFCSSVVTVVSRAEHLASSQWSKSNRTVTLAVNLSLAVWNYNHHIPLLNRIMQSYQPFLRFTQSLPQHL